jgi:phosphoribosylaminoimidazole-succinocarboxamide synthase
MRDEQLYKQEIAKRLDKVLLTSDIPALGEVYHGKVRDVYVQDEKIIMIATDNLSTFDHVMETLIPYKGIILNMFAKRSFEQVKDILPSAMLDSPDPNVVVQKKLTNV